MITDHEDNDYGFKTYLNDDGILNRHIDNYIFKQYAYGKLGNAYEPLDNEIFINGAEESIFNIKEGPQSIKALIRYKDTIDKKTIKNYYLEITNAFIKILDDKEMKYMSVEISFPMPELVECKELSIFKSEEA